MGSGMFKGVGSASVSQTGVYFIPGNYVVTIKKVFTMRSRKKDDLFIVEAVIDQSNVPERPHGSKASWVVNFKNDAALGNIKGFIAAVNGIDPSDEKAVNEQVDEDTCEYVVGDDNPLEGKQVNLTCVNIKTKAGGDFTLHQWSPAED